MNRWDGIGLLGTVLLAVGLWWAWPPACLIGVGLGLLGLAGWGARNEARTKRPEVPDPDARQDGAAAR